MRIKQELILRKIADDYFLVPVGKTVYQYNGLFALSEVGARTWELLPDAETADDIAERLAEEYDTESITELEILRDVQNFLTRLREFKIL